MGAEAEELRVSHLLGEMFHVRQEGNTRTDPGHTAEIWSLMWLRGVWRRGWAEGGPSDPD